MECDLGRIVAFLMSYPTETALQRCRLQGENTEMRKSEALKTAQPRGITTGRASSPDATRGLLSPDAWRG